MRILVVGDVMIDQYMTCTVDRLNPEGSHIPLLTLNNLQTCLGGAGNVAENLRHLNIDVTVACSQVGCCYKTRVVLPTGQTLYRLDSDSAGSPADVLIYKDESFDALIISDYCKGAITEKVACQLSEFGLPTFIDTKRNPQFYRKCGFLFALYFPNSAEFEKYRKEYTGDESYVLKESAKGAQVHFRDHRVVNVKSESFAKNVINVTGAGDTVIAAFTTALVAATWLTSVEKKFQFALEFAMRAAAIAVQNSYTYAPYLDEIVFPIINSAFPSADYIKIHKALQK